MRNRGRAASPAGALPAGLLVALLALVTGGCGGSSGGPVTLPSLPSSPAGSPTPSPSAAPSGIDAPTPQGAAAFARFFYAQVERAFAERDPTLIARLSAPTCESCQNYIRSVQRLRDRNESVTSFQILLTFVQPGLVEAQRVRDDVGWNAPSVTRLDARGDVVKKEEALRGVEEQLTLKRAGGSWTVADYVRIRVRG